MFFVVIVLALVFEFWEGCGSLQYSDHLLWEKLPMVSWASSIGNTPRVPWPESQEPIYHDLETTGGLLFPKRL